MIDKRFLRLIVKENCNNWLIKKCEKSKLTQNRSAQSEFMGKCIIIIKIISINACENRWITQNRFAQSEFMGKCIIIIKIIWINVCENRWFTQNRFAQSEFMEKCERRL